MDSLDEFMSSMKKVDEGRKRTPPQQGRRREDQGVASGNTRAFGVGQGQGESLDAFLKSGTSPAPSHQPSQRLHSEVPRARAAPAPSPFARMAITWDHVADANSRFREYMEDDYKVIENFGSAGQWYFGVYDGHGGRQAVDLCVERFHEVILREMEGQEDIAKCLKVAFQKFDNELRMNGAWENGCTASVCIIKQEGDKNVAYVANVGDSRIIRVHSSMPCRRLTVDHVASDTLEIQRVQNEGGVVMRGRIMSKDGKGSIAVSRSLGDHKMKECGVIATPNVLKYQIQQADRALVLASDGLWDVYQDDEVATVVRTKPSAAATLVAESLSRGSRDNITCLVVKLTA